MFSKLFLYCIFLFVSDIVILTVKMRIMCIIVKQDIFEKMSQF